MKIQLLRPHLLFKTGQIVDTLGDGLCRVLIDKGIAKAVDGDDVPNKMIGSTEDDKAGDDRVHTKPHKHGHKGKHK